MLNKVYYFRGEILNRVDDKPVQVWTYSRTIGATNRTAFLGLGAEAGVLPRNWIEGVAINCWIVYAGQERYQTAVGGTKTAGIGRTIMSGSWEDPEFSDLIAEFRDQVDLNSGTGKYSDRVRSTKTTSQ